MAQQLFRHDCNGFNFKQPLFADQAAHLHRGAHGRMCRVDVLIADLAKYRRLFDVDEIAVQLVSGRFVALTASITPSVR
jgi:hypothetical protein